MRQGETRLLLGLLLVEAVLFSFAAPNFATAANAAEIIRLSVELGILSLALTCVVVTGGIDLSVGSLVGLCAVSLGWLIKEAGVAWPLAAGLTLGTGLVAGALNGALITRFRALPLIVTLGTFSLFRGLAEGITGGVKNFTDFPASFLWLGQGYLFGVVPVQVLLFAPAAVAFAVLLHRSIIGRTFYAIGHSADAARVSAVPVDRRVLLAYTLSGLAGALAAIVYVARVGQAKSDAGLGYELLAITAVVLGGTSISGGKGTIAGSLLGLLAIVVLTNGLRLAALPTELAGILTGVILLLVIGLEKAARWRRPLIAAAGLLAVCGFAALAMHRPAAATGSKRTVLGMMPKAKGDPYFVACLKGAQEAAKQFDVELIWDGPADLDPARQNEVVESWITRGVDVIAVSVENRGGLSTVLRKARARGIKVLTWDADADADARDFFINQATAQGIGDAITDQVAQLAGGAGNFAIVTSSLTAANQNEWMGYMRKRMEKYPQLKLATVRPSDGDRDRAFAETQTILRVYPDVKVIAGIAAPAVPGAAEAVKQSGRTDVKVTGLSLPSLCKPYVHAGVIGSVVLWNTGDLGYLTVFAAHAIHRGGLAAGADSIEAGRLGKIEVRKDQVILGAPFIFTKDNIDRFHF